MYGTTEYTLACYYGTVVLVAFKHIFLFRDKETLPSYMWTYETFTDVNNQHEAEHVVVIESRG